MAAAGQVVPGCLLQRVAAMALLELQDVALLAARALGGGPHALAAAIELAGHLISLQRDSATPQAVPSSALLKPRAL